LSPGSAGSKPLNHGRAGSLHPLPMYHGEWCCPSHWGDARDRQEQSRVRLSLAPLWQAIRVGDAAGDPRAHGIVSTSALAQEDQHRHIHLRGSFLMSILEL